MSNKGTYIPARGKKVKTEIPFEFSSKLLDEIVHHCEITTTKMEKIYGGETETHSFRVDQSMLFLIESLIERHFKSCEMHEVFMKRIRKSKNIIINQKGIMGLAARHSNILNEQAKEAIIKISEISQELADETGIPVEIFMIRFLLSYMPLLSKIYVAAKSKYMMEGRF